MKNDQLAPIRSIYEQINFNFVHNYNCGPSVCIDKMLINIKKNCDFIVNISGNVGIKIFLAVDCNSSYISKMEIYCGIQKNEPNRMSANHNRPFEVMKRLTEHLIGCNRTVTAGNWFSSKKIVDYLYINKTRYVGSLQSNRSVVKEFKFHYFK